MNIDEVKEVKIMDTSLRMLRIPYLFPTTKEMNSTKSNIYRKFLLVNFSSSYFWIGAALHMTFNIQRGVFYNVDKDISTIISYYGASYFVYRYLFRLKDVIILFKQLSDFNTFGQPTNFVKRNSELNRFSQVYVVYHMIVIILMVASALLTVSECKENNLLNNLNEVCGLPAPTWLPFRFDSFPMLQIVYLYETYSAMVVFQTSGYLSYCAFELMQHVVLRFQHAEETFVEALNEPDPKVRRRKFAKAVRYHQAVIGMGELLNTCFSGCMMTHIIITGPALGFAGFAFLTEIPLDSTAFLIGLMISTYIVCLGGQQLMEASTSIADNVFDRVEWYNLEPSLQRDLSLVLLRSARPILLRAGPFGPINYNTLVMILKTSYSYVTLLKETM